jgi:8-oxo-dGTP pyrophosphatase MutT (NUDIX family)
VAEGDLQVGREVRATRPAEPSASTVLVRDGEGGLEVCMLERHIETDFAGGALVFPGGKLDARDAALPETCWDGIDPAAHAAALGVEQPEEALALHVCAVRETFEEAGVLLARTTAGASGEVTVIYPTRKLLESLTVHSTAADLLGAARRGDLDLRPIQPRLVQHEGRTMVQHPDGGDPEPG